MIAYLFWHCAYPTITVACFERRTIEDGNAAAAIADDAALLQLLGE